MPDCYLKQDAMNFVETEPCGSGGRGARWVHVTLDGWPIVSVTMSTPARGALHWALVWVPLEVVGLAVPA